MQRVNHDVQNLSSSSKRVLVIDDEKNIRDLIDEILTEEGYEVFLARNGQDGVDLFEKYNGSFAVVILDIIMPELDGKDCYYRIKEINPRVKVILTSGYSKSNVKEELIRQGVDAYIPKPFNVDGFLETVQKIVF